MDVFGVREQGSFFWCKARHNGTLSIVAIGATLDHGDRSAITTFIDTQMENPEIQPLLKGSDLLWTSSDIVSLLIEDPTDEKQPLLRGFLFMAMISGRFQPDIETQKMIWANPVTAEKPVFPQVPAEWWELQERNKESGIPDPDYLTWYMEWLQGVMGGG